MATVGIKGLKHVVENISASISRLLQRTDNITVSILVALYGLAVITIAIIDPVCGDFDDFVEYLSCTDCTTKV